MMNNQFPTWIFKNKHGMPYAFKNLKSVEGFTVAVRVGWDGVCIYGKNGISPSLYYMNSQEFASLEDFKGSKGQGFKPFEVGAVRIDGSYWFSDCIFEPGLVSEDFIELRNLLLTFAEDFKRRSLGEKRAIGLIS